MNRVEKDYITNLRERERERDQQKCEYRGTHKRKRIGQMRVQIAKVYHIRHEKLVSHDGQELAVWYYHDISSLRCFVIYRMAYSIRI
jgi:hypothetical protein